MKLRIQTLPRQPEIDAQREGQHLAHMVQRALQRRVPAPVAVLVRSDRTDLLDLRSVVAAKHSIHAFIAGLSRSKLDQNPDSTVVAVGVAGRFTTRQRNAKVSTPVALAFLEWSDCRWWQWQGLLDGNDALVPDSAIERSAEAGDPLPMGLGRWWTLGRKRRLQVHYRRVEPVVPVQSSELVH